MATTPLPLHYRHDSPDNLTAEEVDSNFQQVATGLAALTDTVAAIGGVGAGVTQFVQLTDKASADIPNINNPLATALSNKLAASHAGTGGTAHAAAIPNGASGFMSGADKAKLDSVSTGVSSFVGLSDAATADIPTINAPTSTALASKLATSHAGAGGPVHANVVAGGSSGFMSGSDKAKLDSMVSGPPLSGVTNYVDLTDKATVDLPAINTPLGVTLSGKLPTSHAGTGGAAHANVAAGGAAGFMTGTDKTKLDGIAFAATNNSSDATLLARANHTGTQVSTTISDFVEATQDVMGALIVGAGGTYNDAAGTIALPGSGGASITNVSWSAVWPLDSVNGKRAPGNNTLTTPTSITLGAGPVTDGYFEAIVIPNGNGLYFPSTWIRDASSAAPDVTPGKRSLIWATVLSTGEVLYGVAPLVVGAADTTAPLWGTPHIENAARSIIVVPVNEGIRGTPLPTAGDIGLTNAGGRTVTGVAVASTLLALEVTLSAAADWQSAISIAIAAGKVQDLAGNPAGALASTLAVNNIALPYPGVPTSLVVGTPGSTSIPLSWTPPAADSTHGTAQTYVIEYELHSSPGSWAQFGSPITGTSVTITGLSSATAYDVQVKSRNATGDSAYVRQDNVTTGAPASPYFRFGALTGSAVESGTGPFVYTQAGTAQSYCNMGSHKMVPGVAASIVFAKWGLNSPSADGGYSGVGFETSNSVIDAGAPEVFNIGSAGAWTIFYRRVTDVTGIDTGVGLNYDIRLRKDAANVLYVDTSPPGTNTWTNQASMAGDAIDYYIQLSMGTAGTGGEAYGIVSQTGMVPTGA
jgi:Fibronectin type III domain